ncbi:MAG: FapA family protein [Phycisphaerales bacterium]
MSSELENKVRVRLSDNHLTATLQIEAGTDPSLVTEQLLIGVAVARGVPESDALRERIRIAEERYDPAAPERFELVIAEGTSPRPGENGRFELVPALDEIRERARRIRRRFRGADENDTSASVDDRTPDGDPDEPTICHYDRSTLLLVEPGETIGHIIPNTPGVDGVDACGVRLRAKDGVPCTLDIDPETVRRDENGALIALTGGLVQLDEHSISITDTLLIQGHVDFSTGHVEFVGDITVLKGVRDNFCVDARRSLSIEELVEAAEIRAGRDITLRRGMAGRDKGEAHAGRDLAANYLDSCLVRVGRDLKLGKELSACDTVVGRDARCPHATMVGGTLSVARQAEFAQIGSESGTHTLLRLGRLDALEELLAEARAVLDELDRRLEKTAEETARLRSAGRINAGMAEQLTELQFAEASLEERRARVRRAADAAEARIAESTSVDLLVHKRLMHGTEVHAGGWRLELREDLAGPLRLSLDDESQPVITDETTGTSTPAAHFGKLTPLSEPSEGGPTRARAA